MGDRGRSDGGRKALLLAAFVLGCVAVAGWSWQRSGPPPAPMPGGEDRGAAARVAASEVRPAPLDPALVEPPLVAPGDRSASADERGAISGTARLASGDPLSDLQVELASVVDEPGGDVDRRERGRRATDAQGRFRFTDLVPGRYRVQLAVDAEGGREVEVAAGASVEVELCPRRPAVVGRMSNHGAPYPAVSVECTSAEGLSGTMPANDGQYRLLVGAGRHRLQATVSVIEVGRPRREFLGRAVDVDVPPGAAVVRCDIELALTRVELIAEPGHAGGVAGLAFAITGRSLHDGVDHTFEIGAVSRRHAELDLPAGRWTVRARAPAVIESAPVAFETASEPRLRVVIAVQPAAVVELAMRRATGQPWSPPAHSETLLSLLPRLLAGNHELACERLDEGAAGLAGRARIGWRHVPIGAARFDGRGEIEHGTEIEFLPVDPIGPQEFDVHPGDNRLDVVVEPRAFVTLVACERTGREDPRGRIQVFAGGRTVRPACSPGQSRWQAFLPPGEYRVAIARPAGTTETTLYVQRDPIMLRLRP